MEVNIIEKPPESVDQLTGGLRESAPVYFWSVVAINTFTALAFAFGGYHRYQILQDIGQVQRSFSRLFKCKMSLYCVLVSIDLGLVVTIFVHSLKAQKGEYPDDGEEEEALTYLSQNKVCLFSVLVL